MLMVDFGEILGNFKDAIDNLIAKIQAYFKSLTQYETYAWIAFGVGFILVIIALVTW
jgi:hypothetical protein